MKLSRHAHLKTQNHSTYYQQKPVRRYRANLTSGLAELRRSSFARKAAKFTLMIDGSYYPNIQHAGAENNANDVDDAASQAGRRSHRRWVEELHCRRVVLIVLRDNDSSF